MNCAFHDKNVAVATCSNCNIGLCKECVDTGLKLYNKTSCKNCNLNFINEQLIFLDEQSKLIKKKKLIWSVILVVGALLILGGFFAENDPYTWFFFGLVAWGFAGFTDRLRRKYEFEANQSTQSAMRNAMLEQQQMRDGSIWLVWIFKLFWFLVRAVFFPIFYVKFMLFSGEKEIQNEVAEAHKYKAILES